MSMLVVVFKLQDGADPAAYERWARDTDLPIVRGLASVRGFNVMRVTSLLGSDAEAPYDYVEIIDIGSLDQFGRDVATDTMARVANEFRSFADDPVFMLTSDIEAEE